MRDIRKEYEKLTQILINRNMTVTTMESCTSGQIASLITDTEGASAVMKGAYVTYCNEAKIMQGVPADVIETFGVYSRETAEAMASACRRNYRSDIGIGVTGTFGNKDLNNPDSVPGQVYFAIDMDGEVKSYEKELGHQSTRYEYKLAVAGDVINELLKVLK